MEVDPKRIDPLSYSRAQVAICLKDALSAVLFELRKHAVRCSNQSLLALRNRKSAALSSLKASDKTRSSI